MPRGGKRTGAGRKSFTISAAEYETLLEQIGTASAGMDAQSIAHGMIIFFIIFANFFYFLGKRRKR